MNTRATVTVLLALCALRTSGTAEDAQRLARQKRLALLGQAEALKEAWSQCSSSGLPGRQSEESGSSTSFKHGHGRPRRDAEPTDAGAANKAVYLSESTGTLLGEGDTRVPWRHFTVALWLKPEGGQPRMATILGKDVEVLNIMFSQLHCAHLSWSALEAG